VDELVMMAVELSELPNPPPAVAVARCRAHILHLEQRDAAARMLVEEVEVRIVCREDLNSIAAGKRELCRCGLLELDTESHDVAQKADHRLVLSRRDAEPA
jgi:hypothetical protein